MRNKLTPVSASLRFRRRLDTGDLCSAEYRGHTIDCTRDWRRREIWHCMVRTKAGELVAEYRHEGHDRRGMLEESARKAGLVPEMGSASDEPDARRISAPLC